MSALKTSTLYPQTSSLNTVNLKPQAYKPQTSNLNPQTSNLKPRTTNLEPKTSNFKPQTSNLKPPTKLRYTQFLTPQILTSEMLQKGT